MNVNHVTDEDAMEVAESALKHAARSGKWMIAVWAVEDGNINLVGRTTWRFPTGDFKTAIKQLTAVCDEELSKAVGALPNDPLPLAVLNDAGFARAGFLHKEVSLDDVNKELGGPGPVDGFCESVEDEGFGEPVEEEEDAEQI